MIYAKIMPSPFAEDKAIVSLMTEDTWLGLAQKLDAGKWQFNLTCKDVASAWDFENVECALSWVNSLINLGLDVSPVITSDNTETTSL